MRSLPSSGSPRVPRPTPAAFARLIGRAPHPAGPETVALYASDLARRGRAPATIARRLVSIAVYHRAAGYASPTEHGVVRAVVSGLRRQLGAAQLQKTALEIDPLRAVLTQIPGTCAGYAIALFFSLGGRRRCGAPSLRDSS